LPESRNPSYPTFPPPLRVSYSIQIPKTIRLKLKTCRALSSPPAPQRPCGIVRTRPQRGLAGVFSISGLHLVRLVPQFESGQNRSYGLHRLHGCRAAPSFCRMSFSPPAATRMPRAGPEKAAGSFWCPTVAASGSLAMLAAMRRARGVSPVSSTDQGGGKRRGGHDADFISW
jgi:hypothetical protein